MQFTTTYASPIGNILLATDEEALTGLWFEGQKYYADILQGEYADKSFHVFEITKKWLDVYFSGKEPDFMPPVNLKGTAFQKEVWEVLQKIPYGKTITYGEISKQVAKKMNKSKMSAQAVGGAVGRNHISIIVPCHRVVGANGSYTGYAGGIDKKIKLLTIEKVDMTNLFIPK